MEATPIPAIRLPRGWWRGLLVACVASLTAGCAVNPVSGRPEVAVLSADKERELGDQEAKKVEASMGLVAEPALLAYVQAVGSRVARQSPRQDTSYTFQIVNRPEPNAFALPNGNIYISRGLLALANSEEELAGVLGHEVVHVAARHTVRSANVAVATSPLRIATGIAGVAAGILAPRVGEGIMGLGEAATEAFMAPYGRSQEREADDVGIELAARAGYDPTGLPRILRALERDEALQKDGPPRQSFFDTHPATPERVQETQARAAGLHPESATPVAKTPREFLARLDGLLVGNDPADGAFVESRFFHPGLGIALRFPAGWETRNTPRAVLGHTRDKEAVALLTVAGKGNDPGQVAREAEREAGVRLLERAKTLEINGLRAVRSVVAADGERGPTTLDFTWIAHGGVVYRIVGVSPTPRYSAYRPLFDQVVSSFRAMTSADMAQIREARLRLVTARAGERPGDVARRTGSVWSGEQIAVVNNLASDARLAAGQVLKVALSEPYRNRRY
ncbi:MAG TPA: M48 family metalloprotease [Candidatus Methylomirabilis sp.]|nr:M48 family metalloprotease [Candidatus Methylomirabilis sp.]